MREWIAVFLLVVMIVSSYAILSSRINSLEIDLAVAQAQVDNSLCLQLSFEDEGEN